MAQKVARLGEHPEERNRQKLKAVLVLVWLAYAGWIGPGAISSWIGGTTKSADWLNGSGTTVTAAVAVTTTRIRWSASFTLGVCFPQQLRVVRGGRGTGERFQQCSVVRGRGTGARDAGGGSGGNKNHFGEGVHYLSPGYTGIFIQQKTGQ